MQNLSINVLIGSVESVFSYLLMVYKGTFTVSLEIRNGGCFYIMDGMVWCGVIN